MQNLPALHDRNDAHATLKTARSILRQTLVLKVGGSLARTAQHRSVLSLVEQSTRPIVVVPGGGASADAVRCQQRYQGFNDERAHFLALEAMDVTGQAFVASSDRLIKATDADEMNAGLRQNRVPVWSPGKLLAEEQTLPRNWRVTSDALAAWLAEFLGAERCVLVKSCETVDGKCLTSLARDGITDPVFPEIVARSGFPAEVMGPKQLAKRQDLFQASDCL